MSPLVGIHASVSMHGPPTFVTFFLTFSQIPAKPLMTWRGNLWGVSGYRRENCHLLAIDPTTFGYAGVP